MLYTLHQCTRYNFLIHSELLIRSKQPLMHCCYDCQAYIELLLKTGHYLSYIVPLL